MVQLPDKQTALTFGNDGNLRVSHEAHVATLKPDMIIVKTAVVSVNPVDTKMEAGFSKPGLIGGLLWQWAQSGAVMGSDPLDPSSGAFATYVSAPADITLTLPENVPWSVGGAMSTIWFTVGQALFQNLLAELDVWPILRPAKESKTVLVYGGSTSVGTTAIQLLKLAGLCPIATCSPKNYELVKSYGAEEVSDYRSPTCAEDIKKATRNNLKYALDCISTKGSIDICYGAIGRAGGHYTSLDPFWESTANTMKAIKATWIVGISMLGKDIAWPPPYERPGSEETRAFGGKLAQILQKILDEEKMQPHPLRIKEQATWNNVLEGLDEVKSGKMSGEKLVFVF
ncbi:enoyl reductase [Trichophyton equinum CBS 127.97]|uniref:Enoyl reductase n=1 Tax=Trichophyton equinum (strain ATCC MYA-4606 / CBS 127.97) TaxID=559882 RepID=F2PRG8_TRIEC|nr:enoyl reductase [Trichophyton equinum CBS 127.97]